MAKFLFIYRDATESRAKPSPEEMQALQGAWYAWMQKFSSAIVPGGDGLKHSGRVLKAGIVTDGPYSKPGKSSSASQFLRPKITSPPWRSPVRVRQAIPSRSANSRVTHDRTLKLTPDATHLRY